MLPLPFAINTSLEYHKCLNALKTQRISVKRNKTLKRIQLFPNHAGNTILLIPHGELPVNGPKLECDPMCLWMATVLHEDRISVRNKNKKVKVRKLAPYPDQQGPLWKYTSQHLSMGTLT